MARKDYKTKGFSYHVVNDADVIKHIEKQPNQSSYIISLVRQDMNKQDNDIEKLVRKYVKEMLKENRVNIDSADNVKATKKDLEQLLNIGKMDIK